MVTKRVQVDNINDLQKYGALLVEAISEITSTYCTNLNKIK